MISNTKSISEVIVKEVTSTLRWSPSTPIILFTLSPSPTVSSIPFVFLQSPSVASSPTSSIA